MLTGALTMSKSSRRSTKPAKPYPDFPLFPHATKRWAKKIKGRMVYFGPWTDPDGALQKYLDQKDDLFAGRKPRSGLKEGLTIADLCNKFLNAKRGRVETRELTRRSWEDYKLATDEIIAAFGKDRLVEDLRPDDFEQLRQKLAKGRKGKQVGPVRLRSMIVRTRSVFKFAAESELVEKAVRYGQSFRPPPKKAMRKARNEKGPRMFEAAEIRALLAKAPPPLKAMLLLGINCGFGNGDCGKLPLSALDLDRGWVNFPRPKTEIARRCPLWPETVDTLRAVLAQRPEPKKEEHKGLVFVTKFGDSWAKETAQNPLSKEIKKLLTALKISGNRNFYALRHTFETVAGETERQVCVDFIMGHSPKSDDMSAVYRERIGDDRLRAVTDHVRAWLFPSEAGAGGVLPFAVVKAE